MKKKYFTEEERKAANREKWRKYKEANPDKIAEIQSKFQKKYHKTKMGRALQLIADYRKMDRRNGFGDCIDFDARWIVDNIFTQKCKYCDCTDWHKLGCNRINNDLPHIKSNVECCCKLHNLELAKPYFAEKYGIPVAQYDKVTGELVAVWKNAHEVERVLGFKNSNISKCCRGEREQAYGFVWRRITKEEYEILRACLG